MKVAVLSGGFSEEQYSSRESAAFISAALARLGHEPHEVEYNAELAARIKEISPDSVFHIVQGKHHGDGAVQAMLGMLNLPYTGSRPQAAAIINHKALCKKLCFNAGIRTPDFFEFSYKEYITFGFAGFMAKAKDAVIELPLVVKAPTQGGRYGIAFVKNEETFAGIESCFQYDDVLLCEKFVDGRFITHGILEIDGEMTGLSPAECIENSDDELKLFCDKSDTIVPDITEELLAEINETSLAVAELVGASGFARIDYHLSGGKLYFLEINAVPGLKDGFSDMVFCGKFSGYTYDELIAAILRTAE